jgi:hypothetical protein
MAKLQLGFSSVFLLIFGFGRNPWPPAGFIGHSSGACQSWDLAAPRAPPRTETAVGDMLDRVSRVDEVGQQDQGDEERGDPLQAAVEAVKARMRRLEAQIAEETSPVTALMMRGVLAEVSMELESLHAQQIRLKVAQGRG